MVKEVFQLISRNEEKLQATMTDAQKELFSRYTDSVQEFQTMTERLLFQNSFRLEARMMLAVMEEDNRIYDSSAHRSTVIDGCCFAYK